jgi:D-glycero-D-manno-heptose 1,7-bisphosphate phosphatase
LFLDRDGVINVDRGYVYLPQDFAFIDGIFAVVRRAAELGFRSVVVTNQAGIARGYYSERDFENLTRWMCERFANEGAPLAAVYHCPYHREGIGQWRIDDHPDRKPNPGMILAALRDLDLDAQCSLLVGDKEHDILAARRANLGAAALFAPTDPVLDSLADEVLADHRATLGWLERVAPTLRSQHASLVNQR